MIPELYVKFYELMTIIHCHEKRRKLQIIKKYIVQTHYNSFKAGLYMS